MRSFGFVLAALLPVCLAGTYEQNVPKNVFNVDCQTIVFTTGECDCNTVIPGASIDVEEGYVNGRDTLSCPACAGLGIQTQWISRTGVLKLTGNGKTINDFAKAIDSINFLTTSGDGNSRRITYNYGHALYTSITGHFYEYYPTSECSTSACRWDDGQASCADKKLDVLGLVGYLATITSAGERDITNAKIQGHGWLGGSDVGRESTWKWVTGPEGCPPYDTSVTGAQRSACDFGYPLPDTKNPCSGPDCNGGTLMGTGARWWFRRSGFGNWAGGEPNEWSRHCGGTCFTTGEDFLHFYGNNGLWNDYPHRHNSIDGFMCEWGGVGELCMDSGDVFKSYVLVSGCDGFTSQDKCEAHIPVGSCAWDINTGSCIPHGCHVHEDEAQCGQDPLCDWDLTVSPAACVDNKCASSHTDVSSCNGDLVSPCRWDDNQPDGAQCQPLNCGDITDMCTCTKLGNLCLWDPSSKTCLDPDQSTCPAADVIFVVPGTKHAGTQFGTHTNGYYGLMEHLRHWTSSAHMAGASDSNYGFRAAYVTYGRNGKSITASDSTGAPATFDNCKTWDPVTGTTGNNGGFSMNPHALNMDISFLENFYCPNWAGSGSYAVPGLQTALSSVQAASANGRKKYVFIVAESKLSDSSTDLANVVNQIKAVPDTEVFGIVPRALQGSTSTDVQAEAKLKPLVTSDKHIVNVELANLGDEVLSKLCDASTTFGSVISTKSDVGCRQRDETDCKGAHLCLWDISKSPSCVNSPCLQKCTEVECNSQAGCQWDAALGVCEKDIVDCSLHNGDKAACENNENCVFEPVWAAADTCATNPCRDLTDSTSCVAETETVSAPCVDPPGNPDYCKLSVCEYDDSKSPKCNVKKCLQKDQTKCEAEDGCLWEPLQTPPPTGPPSTLVSYCAEKKCDYPSQAACVADPKGQCQWDDGSQTCKELPCVHNPDELTCDNDPVCHWDISTNPPGCIETPCGKNKNQGDCDASSDCMWNNDNPAKPYCETLNCGEIKTACECQESPHCTWRQAGQYSHCVDPLYSTCPDLDIGFIIDGSGSMSLRFGNHPHGFFALMNMLQDWVKTLPLTGEDHTVGAQSTVRGGGFRVSFIQFSKADASPADDHPTNCAIGACTDGKLSGMRSELLGDIQWHETNYQSQWTYIHDALLDVAENTIDPLHSPAHREHIVIILADNGLTDYDGDSCSSGVCGACPQGCDSLFKPSYRTILDQGTAKLVADNVTVFGVAIRRFASSNFQDQNAENKLKPLVSSPRDDHFLSLQMDEIPDKLLKSLCDPNSKFGAIVAPAVNVDHFPCASWGYRDECMSDETCEWVTPKLTTCDATTGCPQLNCQELPIHYRGIYECNKCRLARTVITCGANVASSIVGTCRQTACMACCNSTCCDAKPECSWNTTDSTCTRDVCEHPNKDDCENDANNLCKWDPVTKDCSKKECEATFEQHKCAANPECLWDAGVDPPVCLPIPKCDTYTAEAQCVTDVQCTWNCTDSDCRYTLCPFANEVDCLSSTDCEWSGTICVEKPCRYNTSSECAAGCDPNCKWDNKTSTEHCRQDHCKKHAGNPACDKDPRCHWSGTTCDEDYCADYDNDEVECKDDPRCTWSKDASLGCVLTNCSKDHGIPSTASCAPDVNCKPGTDATGDYCEPTQCHDLDSCECPQKAGCYWDPNGGATNSGECKEDADSLCPDLDVVFLLDGSGSMSARFGSHPHGYQGMIEVLKDWVNTIPLTHEPAHTTSTVTGGTFRLAFIQFAKTSEYWACKNDGSGCNRNTRGCNNPDVSQLPGAKCADGTFSGDLTELQNDLTWHERNYMRSATYMSKALEDAVHVFDDSPANRKHVVVIITDGSLNPRSRQAREIPPLRAQLDAKDVITFGVVVRKGQSHTKADLDAEATLKPITSDPHDDHFVNVPLDDMLDHVFKDFCDPASPFGKAVSTGGTRAAVLPCSKWGLESECHADASCEWTSALPATCVKPSGCKNLNCLELSGTQAQAYTCEQCVLVGSVVTCSAGTQNTGTGQCLQSDCSTACIVSTCANKNGCVWNGGLCQEEQCDYANRTACENDAICKWNTTKSPEECEKKQCTHFAAGPCNGDKNCTWDDATQKCYPNNPECDKIKNDALCLAEPSGKCTWNCITDGCEVKKCVYTSSVDCTSIASCQWDNAGQVCQEKHCVWTKENECNADAVCNWENNNCVVNDCYQHGTELLCVQDDKCEWDTANCGICNEKYCQKYNNKAACDSDIKNECRFDDATQSCVDKNCVDYNNGALYSAGASCPCKSDATCQFDTTTTPPLCKATEFENCPNLDIAITFDGSCSTNNAFGQHPSGFEGMLAAVHDWIVTAPLTGEAAGKTSTDTNGRMRLAINQYSSQVHVADCPNCACDNLDFPINGVNTTKCGKLSGDLGELKQDLGWHASAAGKATQTCESRLKPVEEFATEVFKQSPSTRMKILIVVTDGVMTDKDELATTTAALVAQGVKIFAVNVMKGASATNTDDVALASLESKIVTTPAAQNAQGSDLDSLSELFDTFCDPSGKWGATVTAGTTGTTQVKKCSDLTTVLLCDAKLTCDWDGTSLLCGDHACFTHCNETTCLSDPQNTCNWNATSQSCEKIPCDEVTKQDECEKHTECTWDVTKSPQCTEDPCPARTEDACIQLNGCQWATDPAPAKCEPIPCNFGNDSVACNAEPGCEFDDVCPDAVDQLCRLKPCAQDKHLTLTGCQADRLCVWNSSNQCEQAACVQYPDEKCCDHYSNCHWDVSQSPAVCSEKYCPRTHDNQVECDKDTKCMWNSTDGTCIEKNCVELEECRCRADAECFWDHQHHTPHCSDSKFGECPVLDVVFLIDASGSMGWRFGRHPNGFYALMEIFRDWMMTVSLTGEKGGENKLGTVDGIRIGFIQFSGSNPRRGRRGSAWAKKTPANTGTGGRLSGDRNELHADIDWHENKFYRWGTMIEKGLTMAGDVFDAAHATNGRKRILIIISDGRIYDPSKLANARKVLNQENVQTFGVVIRRQAAHTKADRDAESTLKPITSDIHDEHYMNIQMDEVRTDMLDLLCDPNGPWGHLIVDQTKTQAGVHRPCTHYQGNAQTCAADPGCIFSPTTNLCVDSPCSHHCGEVQCTADNVNLCVWNSTTGDCWKDTECAHTTKNTCEGDRVGCNWDDTRDPKCEKTPCTYDSETNCLLDQTCEWTTDPVTAAVGCTPIKCLYNDSSTCGNDPECEWRTNICTGTVDCEEKKCTFTSQTVCLKDPACEWENSKCQTQPCAHYLEESCCDKVDECKWDVTTTPAVCDEAKCPKYPDPTQCNADTECFWTANATGVEKCLPLDCSKLTDRCGCDSNPKCYFKPTPTGGMCTVVEFGECPTLDIAIIIDGSGSMGWRFGKHPHGFYALIEVLRDWVVTLPLNGESGSVGINSKRNNGGVRVGFIQFSGKYSASEAKTVTPSVGTGGRLSGINKELQDDLDWHHNNFYNKGTRIKKGLELAVDMFHDSRMDDDRQRVLIIFGDGQIFG